MIKTPNGKVLNIKVIPLNLTFPKSSNSSILDKECIGCAWHEHGVITWQGSNFKSSCTLALQPKLNSDYLTLICGLREMILWAYARPCTHASSIPNLESGFQVCKKQWFQL
jgi:hypothetical protein